MRVYVRLCACVRACERVLCTRVCACVPVCVFVRVYACRSIIGSSLVFGCDNTSACVIFFREKAFCLLHMAKDQKDKQGRKRRRLAVADQSCECAMCGVTSDGDVLWASTVTNATSSAPEEILCCQKPHVDPRTCRLISRFLSDANNQPGFQIYLVRSTIT